MPLPTEYQNIVHLRSYARWSYEFGRRETWEETVSRYSAFMKSYIQDNYGVSVVDVLAVIVTGKLIRPSSI